MSKPTRRPVVNGTPPCHESSPVAIESASVRLVLAMRAHQARRAETAIRRPAPLLVAGRSRPKDQSLPQPRGETAGDW